MQKILMKCGCIAVARDVKTGKPFCPACMCSEVATEQPNLEGRLAKCTCCGRKEPSSLKLPFFRYKPDKEFDSFYCGCRGWD